MEAAVPRIVLADSVDSDDIVSAPVVNGLPKAASNDGDMACCSIVPVAIAFLMLDFAERVPGRDGLNLLLCIVLTASRSFSRFCPEEFGGLNGALMESSLPLGRLGALGGSPVFVRSESLGASDTAPRNG